MGEGAAGGSIPRRRFCGKALEAQPQQRGQRGWRGNPTASRLLAARPGNLLQTLRWWRRNGAMVTHRKEGKGGGTKGIGVLSERDYCHLAESVLSVIPLSKAQTKG